MEYLQGLKYNYLINKHIIALLKDVPIGSALWRKINGFPPEYYQPMQGNELKDKKGK